MAVAGGGRRSEAGQRSAPGGAGDTSLLGSATTWPLKRYGRFLPPTDSDDEGQNTSSWKVFESSEESGHLILTIVVSGHFFISQGRTVLEGFSLIDSHKWLKIVRRADCLLLHAQSKVETGMLEKEDEPLVITLGAVHKTNSYKIWSITEEDYRAVAVISSDESVDYQFPLQNECRMFRVQFGGDSKEQTLEHCCSCVQKLAEYVPVEVPDEQSQKLYHSLDQLATGEHQVKDTEQNASVRHTPDQPLPDSCASLGERRSVSQLAQSVLKKTFELPLAYRHSAWRAQELGPFIRLCLMDQNFPAFVEDVEKELKKLTDG